MGYAEAKKFARAYDTQLLLQRTQEEEFRTAANAFALIAFNEQKPDQLTDDQLRAIERELVNYMAELTVWRQIAEQLSREYDRILNPANAKKQAD